MPPPDQPLTPFWSDHQAPADARADLLAPLTAALDRIEGAAVHLRACGANANATSLVWDVMHGDLHPHAMQYRNFLQQNMPIVYQLCDFGSNGTQRIT